MCENLPELCRGMFDVVSANGSDQQITEERLDVYLGHFPAGAPLKSLKHFVQTAKGDQF